MSIGSMIVSAGLRIMQCALLQAIFVRRKFSSEIRLNTAVSVHRRHNGPLRVQGVLILSSKGTGPKITHVTTGKVIDKGVTDISNMGAAMAPAAIDTLIAHFNDTHRTPDYYDMILTGDLGVVGSDILVELMLKEGFDIRTKHKDCGKMIFDIEEQDVHAGGSGCGCCGSVFCGYVYRELKRHNLSKVLVMATGALMNPMIIEQGESIPGNRSRSCDRNLGGRKMDYLRQFIVRRSYMRGWSDFDR